MKKLIVLLGMIITMVIMMSHSDGIGDRTNSPSETNCTGCHTSFPLNSGPGSISITDDIPGTGYVPAQTYTINVTIAQSGVPLFGFDFEALTPSNTTAGNIIVTNPASSKIIIPSTRQNITHVTNGGLSNNSKTFTFNWTAPSTNIGNVTFYAAGNAANNNGNNSGDYIYTTSKMIPAAPGNSITTGIITENTFCAGTTGINIPFTVIGTFTAGNVFTAQISNASGSFATPTTIGTLTSTTSGTIVSTSPLPSLAGTGYRIRVVASNPATTGSDNGTNLTISTAPTTANAGSDQSVCLNSGTLAANTPTIGTGTWTVVNGSGTFTNANNPTTTVTGLGTGINTFRWTISNSTCTASTDDAIINFSGTITAANAGSDQSICGTSLTLAGNLANIGTGRWRLISGSGTITDTTNATSTITGLGIGANTFRWIITNGSCTPSTDEVVITAVASPTAANAGVNQIICNDSVSLSANSPTTGTGMWSLVSGTANITAPSSPSTTIYSLGTGITILRWTISNPPCTATFSDVTLDNCANLGTAELSEIKKINIWPNPNEGNLNISFTSEMKYATIEIQNILGEVVFSKKYETIFSGNIHNIDITDVPSNIYLIKYLTEQGEGTMRFIKN